MEGEGVGVDRVQPALLVVPDGLVVRGGQGLHAQGRWLLPWGGNHHIVHGESDRKHDVWQLRASRVAKAVVQTARHAFQQGEQRAREVLGDEAQAHGRGHLPTHEHRSLRLHLELALHLNLKCATPPLKVGRIVRVHRVRPHLQKNLPHKHVVFKRNGLSGVGCEAEAVVAICQIFDDYGERWNGVLSQATLHTFLRWPCIRTAVT
mmetsp:Transcript_31090/g.78041  ORF Transcript_31090/g.78041 Transcript_31090/m.78041 type:complete len:206 (-) Transcript_31090:171-788(-)